MILKFIWKGKGLRKANFEKKNKVAQVKLLNFKTHFQGQCSMGKRIDTDQ